MQLNHFLRRQTAVAANKIQIRPIVAAVTHRQPKHPPPILPGHRQTVQQSPQLPLQRLCRNHRAVIAHGQIRIGGDQVCNSTQAGAVNGSLQGGDPAIDCRVDSVPQVHGKGALGAL